MFKKVLKNFLSIKTLKNLPQKLLIIDPNPFLSNSSPDHSPELIFHIMKTRDQTSVLLSVYYLVTLHITEGTFLHVDQIGKKTVKSFHDTYCRHAIWQENYELFSKTFIYNLDTRTCTKLQSSSPLTYFLYMFIQNLKMWYRKGNLLWSIDNKPLEDWWFQIVYVCLRLSSWLLKRNKMVQNPSFIYI